MTDPLRQDLETVVDGLGDLAGSVVFVGGIVVMFYIDDPGGDPIRITDDVDCVIELADRNEFAELEESLRGRGFQDDLARIGRFH